MKAAEKNLIETLVSTKIAFGKLSISDKNVRVVSPSKEADKQLIASIQHIGLLNPLIVIPAAKQGYYEVVAGGRRFSALTFLASEKLLSAGALIECKITTPEQATLVSLSENLHEAMHPADTYTAYKELANQGKGEKEIASHFGHPVAQVKRLMKLGAVAPALIELYRADKLDLDDLMAFCLTDDHEKQLACYKELSRGSNVYPSRIRSFILNGGISVDSAVVKFVTLAAYKKAGGGVVQDFFNANASYIADVELMQQLAVKRLNTEADSLSTDGWKWVEVKPENSHSNFPRILEPDYSAVPQELLDREKKAHARYEELEEKQYEDELTDEEQAEYEQLETTMESLDLEREAYGQFTQEQKSVSGCVVSFTHSGELSILKGCVRKEDLKLISTTSTNDAGNAQESNEQNDTQEKIEGAGLAADMAMYFRQAFQANLLKHEQLCFDILVYQLVVGVLNLDGSYRRLLSIRAENLPIDAQDITETSAHEKLELFRSGLNLGWSDIEEESNRFNEFCKLKKADKMQLLTYCVAVTATASPSRDSDESIEPFITTQTAFKMADYWKPTETNYFARLRKNNLLAIGQEVCGEAWAKNNSGAKHGALAQALATAPEMADWMPQAFR